MTIASGRLRGLRRDGVGAWLGIPYAAPPVGGKRFRAPHPPPPWAGCRDATRFGASAPQPPSLAERVLGLDGHLPWSEDCLTLNVWSRGPGGPGRPVLVWLHGGSFLTGAGSDSLYDGHGLAGRGDIVVVTVNYRLGPLGFLHLGGGSVGGGAEDNLGLRDQIAALHWVRDNVAAFGGDPEAVTLAGQSAGAMAIGALLASPAARGLFGRAILQSGAAGNVHGAVAARRIVRRFGAALGLRRADVDALRGLPVERLLAAAARLTEQPSLLRLPFQPVVDGDVLRGAPLEAIRAGAAAGVALLIGTNRDELALYDEVARQDPAPPARRRRRRWRAVTAFAAALGPGRLVRLLRAYPAGPRGLARLAGDAVFGWPATQLAEAQAPHAPVFAYRFDWPSPTYGGRLGACHALEVPFAWGTVGAEAARTLVGGDLSARPLSAAMQEAWLAFVRSGRPAAAALPDWPAYRPEERAVMILDRAARVEHDPDRHRRLAWAGRAGPRHEAARTTPGRG